MNRRLFLRTFGSLLALALLFAVGCCTSATFLKTANLLNILRQNSYTGIIAVGMTFVILAGGIDLSVGSMTAWVGVIALYAMNAVAGAVDGAGLTLLVTAALGGGILAGAACGALNGALVTYGGVIPFIATLGTMSAFRSLALYLSDAGEVGSAVWEFSDFGTGMLLGVPVPAWIFAGLAAGASVVLHCTRFGRHVLAVGSNDRVAAYAAIRVRAVRFATYVLSGALTGVTAVLLASRLNSVSSTTTGLNYELDAIAAVIIGGTSMNGGRGTVWGSVVGVLILGIVNNLLNMYGVSTYLQGLVKGCVIVAAVLVQRPGRA